MSISNRQQLTKSIEKLKEVEQIEKEMLLQQVHTMQQSVDPVVLLRKGLSSNKNHVPHLFDNLLDQSFFSATKLLKNKIGLNNGSFVTKAADNLLQKNINRFYADNRYKIKSIALAVAKNIFR
jgi:hypothetical protein